MCLKSYIFLSGKSLVSNLFSNSCAIVYFTPPILLLKSNLPICFHPSPNLKEYTKFSNNNNNISSIPDNKIFDFTKESTALNYLISKTNNNNNNNNVIQNEENENEYENENDDLF